MADIKTNASKSSIWPLDMFDEAQISEGNTHSPSTNRLAQDLKEITALYNVGVVLNSTLDPKEVLLTLYKESSRLVDASNFALAIYDESKDVLIFVLAYHNGQKIKPFAIKPTNSGQLTSTVFNTQSPLLVNDLLKSDLQFELSLKYPEKKARSWLGVPIINSVLSNETTQGIMAIWNDQPNAFDNHDLWLLSAIGTQASIALRNARLFESSQRRASEMAHLKDVAQRQADEMAFINEVARTLSSTLNLDKVLTSIMEEVDDMLAVEAGSLLLTDPATGDLVFQIALGDKASEVKPFRVPKGEGIAGRVAETGKPLVISDVQQDKRHFKVIDKKAHFRTRNILCVPLILHDQIIGVLQVLNKRIGEFTRHDVELLSSIASYAAIAIENARLYETLEAEHNRTIQIEQEARKKLASDLHDGPTQLVAAIMMNLDFAHNAIEKDRVDLLPKTLEEMQDLASRASHQMRTLLFELRPLVLESQGLGAALQVFLERRQKDVTEDQNTRLSLNLKTDDPSGDISRQDGKVEATIFAIVQETVNNAIKHANADNIVVELKETSQAVTCVIRDDGNGFDINAVMRNYATRGSLGMINLRERAESIGAEFSMESEIGKGTKTVIHLPKERQEKEKRIKKRAVTGRLSLPPNHNSPQNQST